jgi:hypothetical protein
MINQNPTLMNNEVYNLKQIQEKGLCLTVNISKSPFVHPPGETS